MSIIELTYTTDLYVRVDTETGKVVKVEVNTQDPALTDLLPMDVTGGPEKAPVEVRRNDERVIKATEIAEGGNWMPFDRWESWGR